MESTASSDQSAKRQKLDCGSTPASSIAAPSGSSSVLQGELLSRVAQYLSVEARVAATATSKAFHQAMTSALAWQDSCWTVDVEESASYCDTYVPATVAKLQHLYLNSLYRKHPTRIFFHRLPVMHSLETRSGDVLLGQPLAVVALAAAMVAVLVRGPGAVAIGTTDEVLEVVLATTCIVDDGWWWRWW